MLTTKSCDLNFVSDAGPFLDKGLFAPLDPLALIVSMHEVITGGPTSVTRAWGAKSAAETGCPCNYLLELVGYLMLTCSPEPAQGSVVAFKAGLPRSTPSPRKREEARPRALKN